VRLTQLLLCLPLLKENHSLIVRSASKPTRWVWVSTSVDYFTALFVILKIGLRSWIEVSKSFCSSFLVLEYDRKTALCWFGKENFPITRWVCSWVVFVSVLTKECRRSLAGTSPTCSRLSWAVSSRNHYLVWLLFIIKLLLYRSRFVALVVWL